MARAFLLHLLEAYLFASGGQTVYVWVVMYGHINPGTDLVLKDFPRVRAHLAGLTFDEVSSRVLVFHTFHAFPLEYPSSNLVSL